MNVLVALFIVVLSTVNSYELNREDALRVTFETYSSIFQTLNKTIENEIMKTQNYLYDIKSQNSTSFECVELYGDVTPMKQLRISFEALVAKYSDEKNNYLTVNIIVISLKKISTYYYFSILDIES